MTNAESNKKFLASVDAKSKDMILLVLAKNYWNASAEIYDDLIDADAENILDYMTGGYRSGWIPT